MDKNDNERKWGRKEVTILYSSSDSYAFLTGISILSLLENNKECQDLNIYIMDNAISAENKQKLLQVVNGYGRELTFVPMPDIEKMTGQSIDTRRWNISTFGRLYMASALPEDVHKVLNIDCDTIVLDSLEELWATDLTGKICGGMPEYMNDRYRRNIGMKNGAMYFNGGIIMLNLDEVRKQNYEQKFSACIAKYGDSLAYLDQDVLNGVVPQEEMMALPMRYNAVSLYFYADFEQVAKIRRAKPFYSKREFEETVTNPAILHFTTCFLDGLRPWIEGNRHPYLCEFLRYKSMSPWKDQPLLKDERNVLIKLRSKIIHAAPRGPLCAVASLLHGVIIPEKNKRRIKAHLLAQGRG